jgi:hypothetical protein
MKDHLIVRKQFLIMLEDTSIGELISWLFGVLFFIGGLGGFTFNIIYGLITTLLGLFLIPPSRSKFEEIIDYKFSRWSVVGIAFVGIVVAGMFVPQDTSTSSTLDTSENGDTQRQQPSGNPSDTVDSYIGNLAGFSTDYRSAWSLTTKPGSYNDWYSETKNVKNAFQQQGSRVEFGEPKTIEQSDYNATVEITARLMSQGYVADTQTLTFNLMAKDGEWIIKGAPNIFSW